MLETGSPLDRLPDELLGHIIGWLSPEEKVRGSLVCCRFARIIRAGHGGGISITVRSFAQVQRVPLWVWGEAIREIVIATQLLLIIFSNPTKGGEFSAFLESLSRLNSLAITDSEGTTYITEVQTPVHGECVLRVLSRIGSRLTRLCLPRYQHDNLPPHFFSSVVSLSPNLASAQVYLPTSLPTDFPMSPWNQLRRLSLSLRGSVDLSFLASLESLNVLCIDSSMFQSLKITGFSPLPHLRNLHLHMVSVANSALGGIALCTSLTQLYLRLRGLDPQLEFPEFSCKNLRVANIGGWYDKALTLPTLLFLPPEHLRELTVYDASWAAFSELEAMTRVEILTLRRTEVSDMSPLSRSDFCPKISGLSLDRCPVTDLSPLQCRQGISSISLAELQIKELPWPIGDICLVAIMQCDHLTLIAPSGCENETSGGSNVLDLRLCQGLKDIGGLAGSPHLGNVLISRCPLLESLQPLGQCHALMSVHLDHLDACTDIAPLSQLESLQALTVQGCPVRDFSPLRHCPNLDPLLLQITPPEDIADVAGPSRDELMQTLQERRRPTTHRCDFEYIPQPYPLPPSRK